MYVCMAVLGLRFCARAFSSRGKRGPLFIAVRGPFFITVRGPLTIVASLVAEHRLQTHRLSSCDSRAQLFRGMRDLPRPGLEPVSPALAGRFPTTAPPGNPSPPFLMAPFLFADKPPNSLPPLFFWEVCLLPDSMIQNYPCIFILNSVSYSFYVLLTIAKL